MTKVVVQSGSCGFSVTVIAEKGTARTVRISLETDCEMVRKMLGDIGTVDRAAALAGFRDNPVYRSAANHLKHAACPVPSGILKALEVESGFNVPKDATVTFDVKNKGIQDARGRGEVK